MTSGADTDDLLARERDRLVYARGCLAAMREALRSLEGQAADPVSAAYLQAELYRRAKALLDDPDTPLFFGRVDRIDGSETFYIGRRHVRDDEGEAVVVDWRAGISRSFYRASAGDPMGMRLRRRFGFSHGVLTSFEDEALDHGETSDPAHSAILTAEIERPRIGPMRDIVATIQPDQDALVRADLNRTLCIQGAPGTGKTAVGLHRAAFLLYAHREQLRRTGVLVVGPNRSFVSYIDALLPALGELDVKQLAIDDLPGDPVPLSSIDPAEVAALKGDARWVEVIRHAIYGRITLPIETLVVEVPGRRWRVSASELNALIVRERDSDTAYDVSRARLPRLVAEAIRRRMEAGGAVPEDRAITKLARHKSISAWVEAHWPRQTAVNVVMGLLSDTLQLNSSGAFSEPELDLVAWPKLPTSAKRAPWSPADLFLIDEATGVLDRSPTFGHVVLDEAQDLTPMQSRAIARRCPAGSLTILGDLAQATRPGAIADWPKLLQMLGKSDGDQLSLTTGYRVPSEVIALANRLLPVLGVNVEPARSLRHAPGSLRLLAAADHDSAVAVVATVTELLDEPGTIGVIATPTLLVAIKAGLAAADVDSADVAAGLDERVTTVPVELCKGLEFDHVVVVEPTDIMTGLARGDHWLYVALTRAVTTLTVVHADPLPVLLAG